MHMANLPMKSRLHRLESEMVKLQPEPITDVEPPDFDAILERIKLHSARESAIEADPDPMVRYVHYLAECAKYELALKAVFIPRPGFTVDTGPQMAALSLPMNQYRLRAAELELLHAAGYDATELQEQHDKSAPYQWRHQPLPTTAQTLLDRNITDSKRATRGRDATCTHSKQGTA